MAKVLQRPQIRSPLSQWLRRTFPAVYDQLVDVALRAKILLDPIERSSTAEGGKPPVAASVVDLSPRGRQIYADLKTAIQQHEES